MEFALGQEKRVGIDKIYKYLKSENRKQVSKGSLVKSELRSVVGPLAVEIPHHSHRAAESTLFGDRWVLIQRTTKD